MYKNEKGSGFCDSIIIHSYPDSPCILKASANFRRGKKIVISIVQRDVKDILAYMARQPFCDGVPYRIITHK